MTGNGTAWWWALSGSLAPLLFSLHPPNILYISHGRLIGIPTSNPAALWPHPFSGFTIWMVFVRVKPPDRLAFKLSCSLDITTWHSREPEILLVISCVMNLVRPPLDDVLTRLCVPPRNGYLPCTTYKLDGKSLSWDSLYGGYSTATRFLLHLPSSDWLLCASTTHKHHQFHQTMS